MKLKESVYEINTVQLYGGQSEKYMMKVHIEGRHLKMDFDIGSAILKMVEKLFQKAHYRQ